MKDFIPGINLAQFCDDFILSDDLAWDHAMDISGSVYARLKELGMSNKDFADKLGVSAGRVSQIIKGIRGCLSRCWQSLKWLLAFDWMPVFRIREKAPHAFPRLRFLG